MDKKKMTNNDIADRSKEVCSYRDMIHHLEVLNTLPPTNGLTVEIEAVRREALEMLYLRNAKEKDKKDG